MRIYRFVLLLLLSVLALPSFAGPTEDFDALLEEHWQWRLAAYPVQASMLGDRRYNELWTDESLEAIAQRQADTQAFLERAMSIDGSGFSEENRLNLELFRRSLQDDIDEFPFREALMPISHRGGVQNLDSLTNYIPLATVEDYEDWLARLATVDEVIAQTITLAEAGRAAGLVPPAILMERVPDQIAAQLVDEATASPFYGVFEALPERFPAEEQERLRAQARDTISNTVLPAYERFNDYFTTTYLPAARDSIGLSDLPNGKGWYELKTRQYTTTDMTPEEIHQLGLLEVERIRGEMQAVIEELAFEGSFQDFLVFLRTDPQFYYDNPEDLYEAYLATSKRIDPELVRLFGTLPRMPYGVKPIPDSIAPDTTTAYYSRPAADGSRAGIYWVNLYKPEVRPRYEIEVLSVHEAMPGHHLQIALQQELGDMPNFRRYMGFTAFVEGWGLYSESLGYDLGLYQDLYSKFGALTYDMWRAVRLVVDTGIHYMGWSRQQAIDFFKENAAKTELDIINEIDRYIGNPGQALAYKIGQLKMLELRAEAEAALGDSFDIRAFHDELLGAGSLPLDLLEQRMDAWVEAQLAVAASTP